MLIANAYPREAEITEGLSRKSDVLSFLEILELAEKTVEVLVREPVRSCRITGSVFLDSGAFKLAHFPVSHVQIHNQPVLHVDIDETNGIFYMTHPPDSYDIGYEIGHRDGEVPAVIKTLITALSRYLYSGSDEFRSEIVELVVVARRMRQKARDKRNDYKIDREGSREGLARHSPS